MSDEPVDLLDFIREMIAAGVDVHIYEIADDARGDPAADQPAEAVP